MLTLQAAQAEKTGQMRRQLAVPRAGVVQVSGGGKYRHFPFLKPAANSRIAA